ncbi:Putative metallophosphoesterase MG207 [Paenibacillus polymyxa E681]|uniref:metallophosphoesterase family protein n=1 Tax=Paenibacillus polymyxa TaxID=1406 RepID=UPI0001E3163F|nr:metallophosphoesterase family protein [Paenibacillus polymyxa]ADM69857.1 phosphodiesterase [Paenibacillus polymyxa E681]QNV56877.1 Putative metallophosphoesterase MG207 [Paenibacillus polymyxa E681]QNV61714.1 Putative metallophosphoesterase MG207 [Paenibacillus polymyxa E681]
MKIIVLSDTHMPYRSKILPSRLVQELKGSDLILHAGDWTDWFVYERLAEFAPVQGIAGNNDGMDIVKRLGYQRIVEAQGKRIGMVHGHGWRGSTENIALNTFKGETLDCLIYGHSHIPVVKTIDGQLVLNPGSPTDKRGEDEYSFIVLTIEAGQMEAQLVLYPDKH